ncbi:MAG: CPBP family intramembrane glutamic endopeptidase [Hyphomicrobiaceae bacterium]
MTQVSKQPPAAHAGGTLPRPVHLDQPGNPRRMWLIFEMVMVFLAMPLAVIEIISRFHLSLFTVLQPVLLVFVIVLLIDRTFLLRRELTRGFGVMDATSILAIFLIVGGSVVAFVAQELPQLFLSFPKRRPETWQMVMIFYPLLSVIVQELVFRTFFFHRYGPIFGDHRFLLIVVNGLLFGFAHVMFGNWVAVGGTAAAGMLFAYRYETTRSFWAVWLEHTLWGWLVFTVGLGGFFFTGNSNF